MCNINGLKDHSTRHQMDVSDQCKTYRKNQGLPLGTFAFRILLKRRGLNLSEFGVRMSQLSPGLLMSVHRTIQTYGPRWTRLQREAPALAGRRMRYPGSASRAQRPSTGSVPARSLAAADRMRLARAEGRASAHLRRLPAPQLAELLNVSRPGPLLLR